MNVEQAFDFFRVRATKLGTRTRSVIASAFGVGQDGDSDEYQEPFEEIEVLSPIGFKSRPKLLATSELFSIRLGDEAVGLFFIDKMGPTLSNDDFAEGESIVYSPGEPTAVLRMRADGSIDLTAKVEKHIRIRTSGAGEVQLAPESAGYKGEGVARKTDATENGSLTITAAPTGGGTAITFTYTPPGGAPQTAVLTITGPGVAGTVTPPGTLSLAGKITEGAQHAKA